MLNTEDGARLNRREPYFVPDDENIDLQHFYIPAHYEDTLKSLLVPHGVIHDRIEKLAHDITQDYKGQTVHILCVLKGGSTFFSDLIEAVRRFHDCKLLLNYVLKTHNLTIPHRC